MLFKNLLALIFIGILLSIQFSIELGSAEEINPSEDTCWVDKGNTHYLIESVSICLPPGKVDCLSNLEKIRYKVNFKRILDRGTKVKLINYNPTEVLLNETELTVERDGVKSMEFELDLSYKKPFLNQ